MRARLSAALAGKSQTELDEALLFAAAAALGLQVRIADEAAGEEAEELGRQRRAGAHRVAADHVVGEEVRAMLHAATSIRRAGLIWMPLRASRRATCGRRMRRASRTCAQLVPGERVADLT